MKQILVVCPESLMIEANELARCVGLSEHDSQTFVTLNYKDFNDNKYCVVSGLVGDSFLEQASLPLTPPPWGCDIDKATSAQNSLSFEGPAALNTILVLSYDTLEQAIQEIQLERIIELGM
jgi:hypothetical protein